MEKKKYMFLVARKNPETAVRPNVDVIDFYCIASDGQEAMKWHPHGEIMDIDGVGEFYGITAGLPTGWVRRPDELVVTKLSDSPLVDEMIVHGSSGKVKKYKMVSGPFSVNLM